MTREFNIGNQTLQDIYFIVNNLNKADLRFFVVYDTSTGEWYPDYLLWKTQSILNSSTGVYIVPIDDSKLYPKPKQIGTLNYSMFLEDNFVLITDFEAKLLDHFIKKIDLVRSRYPETFTKKFTIEELLIFIEAAIVDIDLYPPMTSYYPKFSEIKEEDINSNPFAKSYNSGVPYSWLNLIVTGALLNALVSQGILEVDINFDLNAGGVNIRYNNIEGIKGWWSSLLDLYEKQKKQIKVWEMRPSSVGTLPFGVGIPVLVSNLLGPLSVAGYPWFRAWSGRP